MPPEFRAFYSDKEPGLFEDDLPWQAQWHDERSLNEDKYERGGWYRTEAEAIEAAKRGKATSHALLKLVESGRTEISREELAELLKPEPMTSKEIVESGLLDEIKDESLPDGGEWREEQQKKWQQRNKW
jgi:hypothetical protein